MQVSSTTKYVPLADYVAILAAADVIVCSHERASQSGIFALARKVCVRPMPSDVGGFGDLAAIGLPPAVVLPRAAGIDGALTMAAGSHDMEPGLAHLRAHGLEPA